MESVDQTLLNTIKSFALWFSLETLLTAEVQEKKYWNHSNTRCEIILCSNFTKHEVATTTFENISIIPVCTSEVDSSQMLALYHPLSEHVLSLGDTALFSALCVRLNWLQF